MPGSQLPSCRAPLGMSRGAAALQTASFRYCSSGKVFHPHAGMTALLQAGFLLDVLPGRCEHTPPGILACAAGSAQVRGAVFAWPVAFGPFQAPGVCTDPAWRARRSWVGRSLYFRGFGAFAAITCQTFSPLAPAFHKHAPHSSQTLRASPSSSRHDQSTVSFF